jgi:hypothetical protein
MTQNIKITLTDEMAHDIMSALHMQARVYLGQTNIGLEDAYLSHPKLQEIRQLLRQVDEISRLEPDERMRKTRHRLWGLYELIRYFLSWRQYPEGGPGTCFQEPLNKVDASIEPTDDKPDHRPIRGRLADELVKVIGTNDLKEAVSLVKKWKASFGRKNKQS